MYPKIWIYGLLTVFLVNNLILMINNDDCSHRSSGLAGRGVCLKVAPPLVVAIHGV